MSGSFSGSRQTNQDFRAGSLPTPRNPVFQFTGSRSSGQRELSSEERQSISEVFHLFDLDQDGFLDIFQLKYSLKALGFNLPKKEVINIIRTFTPDSIVGREFISKENFEKIMEQKLGTRDPEHDLRAAFELFDTEGIGKITTTSLKKVAHDLNQDMTEEELALMIEEFDFDDDNAINFDEFKRIMRSNT